MRDPSQPWYNQLGSRAGINRGHSKQSGRTSYGVDSLIGTAFRVCAVWSEHYLRSDLAQSLDSVIIEWSRSRVWIAATLIRICTVWSETFTDDGKSAQNQEVQTKERSLKKKEKLILKANVFKSISQFYFVNKIHLAKD